MGVEVEVMGDTPPPDTKKESFVVSTPPVEAAHNNQETK
jgi:hypothetical protein